MRININDVITLDNKFKYVVCSKVIYNLKNYFYLVNIDNNKDIKILEFNIERNSLMVINDKKLEFTLIPLLLNEMLNDRQ